jgi:hypothetical protein
MRQGIRTLPARALAPTPILAPPSPSTPPSAHTHNCTRLPRPRPHTRRPAGLPPTPFPPLLQEYLQRWDKTLVVVSHARSFLNSVVTDILHFQTKGITR